MLVSGRVVATPQAQLQILTAASGGGIAKISEGS